MATPIITLTTDFGDSDGYVGAMKGVILTLNPAATVVDVAHGVQRQNPIHGAIVLRQALPYFPAGSVHVAVVDPGVGTDRRALVIESGGHFLVGPDNGVLMLAAEALGQPTVRAITNLALCLPDLSATFHGRDIFAPAAAHLALGVELGEFGPEVTDPVPAALTPPTRQGDTLRGQVTHVDAFGNVVTNIVADDLNGAVPELWLDGHRRVRALATTYAKVRPGEPLLLIGSSGSLEVAVNHGSAAAHFGLNPGATLLLKLV